VLRLKVGAELIAFDGIGRSARARIVNRERRSLKAEFIEEEPFQGLLSPRLSLMVAPPKGKRMAWLVEKATELGAERFVPLVCDHAEASRTQLERECESWRRKAVEACKQSRRARLPEFLEPRTPAELDALPAPGVRRLIAHPEANLSLARASEGARDTHFQVAIGPEGGFSKAEVEALVSTGWEAVSLGQQILRIETAAVAVAALLRLGL